MDDKRIILFLGGMCGDLILKMIEKNPPKHLYIMKKFFNFNTEEKDSYYKNVRIALTHDTDYCSDNPNNVIQIICSSPSKIIKFAERFEYLHRQKVIDEASDAINSKGNFVNEYAQNITDWQNSYEFKHRFDIVNIGNPKFLDDVCTYFGTERAWASNIYEEWCKNEKHLTNIL